MNESSPIPAQTPTCDNPLNPQPGTRHMSYSPETVQLFINLRSIGKTLLAISDQLHVPTSTLGDWNKRYAARIQHERAVKWEFCENGAALGIETDLIRLAKRILACEKELARRPLASMPTAELLRLLSASRHEYFRRRNPLLKALDPLIASAPALESDTASGFPLDSISTQAPEKSGNVSGFPSIPLAPQPLTTNGNHISDLPTHHRAGPSPVDPAKNGHCNRPLSA